MMVCEPPSTSLNTLAASRKEQLQRISDAGLVAQGRVFLLSLEPIKTQIGARWPQRSEIIWDAVERALAKAMPPPDVFVRLNDTGVLVAVASTDSYEAQIRCVEVLRSLLSYFLGRSVDADVGLSRISNLQGGNICAEPVDISAPPPVCATPALAETVRAPDDWIPPLTERRASGTVVLSHHDAAPYVIDVVPVWRLDQEAISAYAIRLRFPGALERLSDLDHEVLSHLALDHALPILEDYRREGGAFAIIIPLSFSALSARRPRLALLGRCSGVRDLMRRAVIAEITDIDAGVPPGLVRETLAMIKPFFRAVTATVRTPRDVTGLYREAAFQGVAIHWRCGQSANLETVLRTARRRTPNLIVHDVPDKIPSDELRRHQASHASWIGASSR